MDVIEYDELVRYYQENGESVRAWAEFSDDGETVISLTKGLLPPHASWTTGNWLMVYVTGFRSYRARVEGVTQKLSTGRVVQLYKDECHIKLDSAGAPFKYDWMAVGESLKNALLNVIREMVLDEVNTEWKKSD